MSRNYEHGWPAAPSLKTRDFHEEDHTFFVYLGYDNTLWYDSWALTLRMDLLRSFSAFPNVGTNLPDCNNVL
jgi:hypothetical protein